MLPQFEMIWILMNSDFHLLSCLISISFWLETHCQYFANVQDNRDCSFFICNKHHSSFKISIYFWYSPLILWTETLIVMERNLYQVLMKDFRSETFNQFLNNEIQERLEFVTTRQKQCIFQGRANWQQTVRKEF